MRQPEERTMGTQIAITAVSISLILVVVALVILLRNRETRQFNRSVYATISQIKVEASTTSSWWVVIAQWSDPQSGDILTFRSARIKFPPKVQPGERVTVHFNARSPSHHHMDM
jgi:hypothetical protein